MIEMNIMRAQTVGGVRQDPRPCFFFLALCMDLRHWVVEPSNFQYDANSPFTVPVDEVLGILDAIGVIRADSGRLGRMLSLEVGLGNLVIVATILIASWPVVALSTAAIVRRRRVYRASTASD